MMGHLVIPYPLYFCVNLFVANCLFLYRMERKRYFLLRLLSAAAVSLPMAALLLNLKGSLLLNVLTLAGILLLTILSIKSCLVISWSDAVFCAIGGYSAQHIKALVYWLLAYTVTLEGALRWNLIDILLTVAVYGLMYYFFGRYVTQRSNIDLQGRALLPLLTLAFFVEIILADVVRSHISADSEHSYFLSAVLTNLMCSLCVLIIQFHLVRQKTLEVELGVISQMRHMEQQQYQISKDTIAQLNIKCHDMRHQIRTMGQHTSISPQILREMEDAIDIYDSIEKTGNQALDIILTEKSLYCQKNGIQLSCLADGRQLSFMDDSDIYSLFGNLLDNAIHAAIPLEPDQRVISLTIRAERGLLSIHSHNYYQGSISLEQGLPLTTNEDKTIHGFGVKSMTMIVEKYGGTISFQPEDGVFNLNMLFPATHTA